MTENHYWSQIIQNSVYGNNVNVTSYDPVKCQTFALNQKLGITLLEKYIRIFEKEGEKECVKKS